MAADVAGYSRLVATDEEGTLRALGAHLREAVEPVVAEHGGRIFKTTGDGFLAEFSSSLTAVRCALEIQDAVTARNRPVGAEGRLEFRIGVHTADVIVEADDLLGDGVNIAARLEALALPGGVAISGRVWEDVQGRLEIGFYDLGEQQLRNMPRPVRVLRLMPDGQNGADVRTSLPLPSKPSIAVLPFHNMSGDPEQEYFADALTDDIVTALSRWRWFFVIARDSSFTYKGRGIDAQRVGQELGVRYLLEGSVRKAASRVRVSAQLIDAVTGVHIWADSFDRELTDIFVLQDEITEQVVGAIEPAMLQSEGVRVARKNPGDLSAFDCFQRGMWQLNKATAEGYHAALSLFRQAIERDPELALSYVGLARTLYGGAVYGWSDQAGPDLVEAHTAALTAIRLDPRDAYAYFAAAGAALYLGGHREALEDARKSIALNPNFGFGHFRLGQVLVYSGRAKEAIAPIERSLRYSPYDPQLGPMHRMLALAQFHAGDYEAAAAAAEMSARLGDAAAISVLAAALIRSGRADEARMVFTPEIQAQARARSGRPMPYSNPADRKVFADAVRAAANRDEMLTVR